MVTDDECISRFVPRYVTHTDENQKLHKEEANQRFRSLFVESDLSGLALVDDQIKILPQKETRLNLIFVTNLNQR